MTPPHIPFQENDDVVDTRDPGRPAKYTGEFSTAGPIVMVRIQYADGTRHSRPLSAIKPLAAGACDTIEDKLRDGAFGRSHDLRRLITFEKLRGSLHDVIYSMDAAQIDFYPYQFKPVMKFIASPTSRLLIADEVGLGKTIESALIWLELQARRQARRLLVVCPNILAPKWCTELRTKFQLDARQVDFSGLQQEIALLREEGPSHPFVLVATYTGLRPPKSELKLLTSENDDDLATASAKTAFLRNLNNKDFLVTPFDLVIFDEAHYMRTTSTTTHHLGLALSQSAEAVLCVSATPVNNKSRDLLSLLRLVDDNVFGNQVLFDEMIAANRPAVNVMNALVRTPVDRDLLARSMVQLRGNNIVTDLPMFTRLSEAIAELDFDDHARVAECQDMAEKVNLVGSYINRTRRIQVAKDRPVRHADALTVDFNEHERRLYDAILALVRRRCATQKRSFHTFAVMGLQLRAASCLPAFVQSLRAGDSDSVDGLYDEALGDGVLDDFEDEAGAGPVDKSSLAGLLSHDFESNDTKYEKLRGFVLGDVRAEKIIIFAFYRGTLAYLRRRLNADGVGTAMIHGGVEMDDRWAEIDRFRDPEGPRVLLSSEVGSEGIDLQFCRIVVNYDLPWNPMRVEQRIGRVDRVNQKAKRISIINFKVRNTIEERLYDKLHQKLAEFANSLGDLEAMIGKEVQDLTLYLLSNNLTPAEEEERIARTERVIAGEAAQVQTLEESGDTLVALSDYVQRKIEENRGRGRYIQPLELTHYTVDFFEQWFPGTQIEYGVPGPECLTVRLSGEAFHSLYEFTKGDRSLSARPFRGRTFTITFSHEAHQALADRDRQATAFVNHLSPLVRWMTATIAEGSQQVHNVSALRLRSSLAAPGTYCYRVEHWTMSGLNERESLAYGVANMDTGALVPAKEAELLFNEVLRSGLDWDRGRPSDQEVITAYRALDQVLDQRFGLAVGDYAAENTTAFHIRRQRVEAFYDRRIAQDRQRLATLQAGNRSPGLIRAMEAKIANEMDRREESLERFERKLELDLDRREIAAGIFMIDD